MATKIISVPVTIERSAPDGPTSYRNLDSNSNRNQALAKTMQAEVDKSHIYETAIKFPRIESQEQLAAMLSELAVRFDTRPDYYTKRDYQLLIALLGSAIGFLQGKMDLQSGNEDMIVVSTDEQSRTLITPQVGQLTDAPEDADGNYTGTDNNERRMATIGDIRNYINNKLTWIEQ